jgi:hypothetical protein
VKIITQGKPTIRGYVLPLVLTGLGQTWSMYNANYDNDDLILVGTATLAGVEDINVQGKAYSGCIRVDITREHDLTFSGSYWLAPDVGIVRGVGRLAGVEMGRVELVERSSL